MRKLPSLLALIALALTAAFAEESKDPAKEQSVFPGINEKYLAPDLKVDEWVERFEREGREVFDNREKIVEAAQIKKGDVVADVGSGTGVFEPILSKAVGDEGKVIAVDIVQKFLDRIAALSEKAGLKNISTHLCKEDSVDLPADSVDKVFICDTYHHFEYPMSTMASIHQALKPGGEVIVVDFKRIEGESLRVDHGARPRRAGGLCQRDHRRWVRENRRGGLSQRQLSDAVQESGEIETRPFSQRRPRAGLPLMTDEQWQDVDAIKKLLAKRYEPTLLKDGDCTPRPSADKPRRREAPMELAEAEQAAIAARPRASRPDVELANVGEPRDPVERWEALVQAQFAALERFAKIHGCLLD
ncbi:MAG: methyltransferase domain-containing protein [Verrucomicrobiales bacterium]